MNKHNVGGNSNLKPNYNYWTIFRIAKEQSAACRTAIYSSWTDNRKVLVGEGKPETGYLKIDHVYDGYDLDTVRFPAAGDAAEGLRHRRGGGRRGRPSIRE